MLDLLRRRQLGGKPGRLRLEQGARGEKLIGLVIGGYVDERAEGGAQIHPALVCMRCSASRTGCLLTPSWAARLVFDEVLDPAATRE